MKETRTKEVKHRGVFQKSLMAVFLLLCSVFILQYAAKAEVYLLESSGDSLFVGDVLTISDYFDSYELAGVQADSIQYAISESSQKKDCIALDQTGKVTALSEGSAVVDVTYIQTETLTSRTESFTVNVLAPEVIAAEYGSTIWLSAFNMYNPYFQTDLWEDMAMQYTYTFSNDSAVLDEDGEGVIIRGFQNIEVYLERENLKIPVAQITVNLPRFEKESMARALNTKAFYPVFENYTTEEDYGFMEEGITNLEEPEWSVEDSSVVGYTESGFQAVSLGTTKITAKFTAENGDELLVNTKVTVTDPQLTADYIVVAIGGTKKLPVKGTCSVSTYFAGVKEYEEDASAESSEDNSDEAEDVVLENASVENSESWDGDLEEDQDGYKEDSYKSEVEYGTEFSYAYINESNKLCGSLEGTEDAVLVVDGRELAIKIIVTNPYYAENTFTMYKKLKKSLPIEGLNKQYSTITYTSSNTKIATVTKNGKVTAKKTGTTKIKIKADGKIFPVWVEVATKKGYKAAKKEIAISKTKTQYSQAKRMSKGYYDCSSLVSRVYRKFGVYFGSKSGWSPTAAGIAQWCSEHKKVLSKKALAYTKLVPGDLVFYSYTQNGRYLNISHVEMYVGNGMSVSASSSNNRVIHYGYSTGGLVMIARPTK